MAKQTSTASPALSSFTGWGPSNILFHCSSDNVCLSHWLYTAFPKSFPRSSCRNGWLHRRRWSRFLFQRRAFYLWLPSARFRQSSRSLSHRREPSTLDGFELELQRRAFHRGIRVRGDTRLFSRRTCIRLHGHILLLDFRRCRNRSGMIFDLHSLHHSTRRQRADDLCPHRACQAGPGGSWRAWL